MHVFKSKKNKEKNGKQTYVLYESDAEDLNRTSDSIPTIQNVMDHSQESTDDIQELENENENDIKEKVTAITTSLEANRFRVQNFKNSMLNVKGQLQIHRNEMLNFLKDMKNAEEMKRIVLRLEDIERLTGEIRQLLRDCAPGSEDENKFIEEHMKLTQEKDALIRKQDYFNILGNLNETTEKIAAIQQKLSRLPEDECKTDEDKQFFDSLMKELKESVDRKNDLTHQLLNRDAEEEEMGELSRISLERTQSALRVPQEPVSTKRRLLNLKNRFLDTPMLVRFKGVKHSGA